MNGWGLNAEDMADIFGSSLPIYTRQKHLEGMLAMLDKNAKYSLCCISNW